MTGASDGIGEAYSYELAKSGFNILLISRTPEKLDKVAVRLREEYKVQTRIVQVDFGTFDNAQAVNEYYAKLDAATADIEVVLLANNAGKAHMNPIHLHTVENCFALVNVNVNSMLFTAKYFLAKFQQRFEATGKRSAIINVASITCTKVVPSLSVYAATKTFNLILSEGMALEYAKSVDVLTVLPSSTKSNMNSGRYLFSVFAEQHAKAVIDQVGWDSKTFGHWEHGLHFNLSQHWLSHYIIESINNKRRLAFLRERDEAKKAEEAAKKPE